MARRTTRAAWPASNASCQRVAHKHHRSPGFRPGKAEFRLWCRKIVAPRFGKFKKRRSHHDADRVTANILLPSVAAAAPIESGHRFERADIKRLAEHVPRGAPSASIRTIVLNIEVAQAACRSESNFGRTVSSIGSRVTQPGSVSAAGQNRPHTTHGAYMSLPSR